MEEFQTPAENITASTSCPKVRQFATPVTSEDIENAIKTASPASTQKDTKYCARIWEDWVEHRAKSAGTAIPHLNNITLNELQHWLCSFVLEIRKKDGNEFPPNTLHHICCGIMRYIRINGIPGFDIFKDKEFAKFRTVLDSEMKRLQGAGIGTAHKKADPITFEEEELLWSKGILGGDTPISLLNTMFYMNGLYFALRGGKEHRNLRYDPPQIHLVELPGARPFLEYREDISKNHPGGLKGRKIKPKIVVHHSNVEKPERCFVRLYNGLCPRNRPKHAYYLQPLQKPTAKCWYSVTPVGHCKLDRTIHRLCEEAGIKGYRTNHSLRATAATRLHQSGCEEQQIMERTGHRSVEAVRSYKRTSNEQQENISDILNNGCPKRPCNALVPLGQNAVVPQPEEMNPCNALIAETREVNNSALQVSSMSVEYGSTTAAPVFNISSCTSVNFNYYK